MVEETKIQKKVEIKEFIKFIKKYKKEQIECTSHTFFRLSEKQRKIYTCEELTKILKQTKPFFVGFQYNQNYAAFYKYKSRNLN